jgi:acetolactate synthase small subunit
VEVWAVLDYTDVSVIEREMAMIKVSLLPEDRPTTPVSPASPEADVIHSDSTPNGFCHYVPPKSKSITLFASYTSFYLLYVFLPFVEHSY